MSVRIGHASIDENGKIKNGAPGDQTNKEVCIREYYKRDWVVIRCKNASRREKIAQAMEKACANDQIGYDQTARTTLYENVKNSGWDPSKTTKKVETDCSALVRVCICYAFGEDVTGNFRTVSEPDTLVKTGLFDLLTDKKYCASSDYLLRGDILCTRVKGHTVVVLDNGAKVSNTSTVEKNVSATEYANSGPMSSLSNKYKTTCNLNIRNGAGTKPNAYGKDKHVLVVAKKGTKVRCYGFYTTVYGTKWLLVEAVIDGVKYTGFCSSKHLKKILI